LLILLAFYFIIAFFVEFTLKGQISEATSANIGGPGIIYFLLAFWFAGVSVTVRRFHDAGMSGWWYLGLFVPIVNIFLYWIIFLTKSDAGENRFGKNTNMKSDLESVFN